MERLERVFVKGKRGYYRFNCVCGNTVIRRSDHKAKYCSQPGCTHSSLIRHGKSTTRLYHIWEGIRGRTIHNSHHSCKTYNQRGISICNDWSDFTNFENWAISAGYSDNLTIDRIDIDKDYSPTNCEWVTRSENTRRQVRDGHSHRTSIYLNDEYFQSISAAARHIQKFTSTKFRGICSALERRLKTNNLKPYKGFVCRKGG